MTRQDWAEALWAVAVIGLITLLLFAFTALGVGVYLLILRAVS